MKTVHRYPLTMMGDIVQLQLARGAQILRVDVKPGEFMPSIWALVDDSEPLVWWNLRAAGTGHQLGGLIKVDPSAENYIGSVYMHGDEPYHFFDLGPRE